MASLFQPLFSLIRLYLLVYWLFSHMQFNLLLEASMRQQIREFYYFHEDKSVLIFHTFVFQCYILHNEKLTKSMFCSDMKQIQQGAMQYNQTVHKVMRKMERKRSEKITRNVYLN